MSETTPHLDREAALRWQMGDARDDERAHVAACAACQAQLQPLTEALQVFRAAAVEWSEAKSVAVPEWSDAKSVAAPAWSDARSVAAAEQKWLERKAAAGQPRRRVALSWAVACALLLTTFALGLSRWQAHQTAHQAALQAAARLQQTRQLEQDDALLESIDQDVSQVLPQALAPLSEAESGTTATAAGQSQE